MDKIAKRVEPTINYWKRFEQNDNYELKNLEDNIAYSVCVMAKNIEADAIVCYTNTGDSARRLSGLGAGCPILVVTDNKRTFRQLGIAWNVFPVYIENNGDINKVIEEGIAKHKKLGNLESGDKVVVAGGSKILPDYPTSKNNLIIF